MQIPPQLDKSPHSPVLILGASGFLGQWVFRVLEDDFDVRGTYFNSKVDSDERLFKVDVTDLSKIHILIERLKPRVIINCVGLSSVESCENRPEANWYLNSYFPVSISKIAKKIGIRFLHVSTDHFDSILRMPREEKSEMFPLNQYGFGKLNAEKGILYQNSESLIIRTNFIGRSLSGKSTLLDFTVERLQLGESVPGFQDVFFTPVGIQELSKFLGQQVTSLNTGIVNFSSREVLSKYEFMQRVALAMESPLTNVHPASIAQSKLKVPRPNYLALNPDKLIDEFNYPLPSFDEMLNAEIKGYF